MKNCFHRTGCRDLPVGVQAGAHHWAEAGREGVAAGERGQRTLLQRLSAMAISRVSIYSTALESSFTIESTLIYCLVAIDTRCKKILRRLPGRYETNGYY